MLNVSPIGFKKAGNVNPLGFKDVAIQYVSAENGKAKTITGEDAFISTEKGRTKIKVYGENQTVYTYNNPTVTRIDKGSSLNISGGTVNIKEIDGQKMKQPEVSLSNNAVVNVEKAFNTIFRYVYYSEEAGELNIENANKCKYYIDREGTTSVKITSKKPL